MLLILWLIGVCRGRKQMSAVATSIKIQYRGCLIPVRGNKMYPNINTRMWNEGLKKSTRGGIVEL